MMDLDPDGNPICNYCRTAVEWRYLYPMGCEHCLPGGKLIPGNRNAPEVTR